MGSIEKGKLADFFLIPGDPLKNLKAIKTISMVVKDGTFLLPERGVSEVRHPAVRARRRKSHLSSGPSRSTATETTAAALEGRVGLRRGFSGRARRPPTHCIRSKGGRALAYLMRGNAAARRAQVSIQSPRRPAAPRSPHTINFSFQRQRGQVSQLIGDATQRCHAGQQRRVASPPKSRR